MTVYGRMEVWLNDYNNNGKKKKERRKNKKREIRNMPVNVCCNSWRQKCDKERSLEYFKI